MENNEISMFMDVKLDIHDKRPESLKFKSWTRCQVKIEAVKCLPCYLRIKFERCDTEADQLMLEDQKSLTVPVNVPGVTISLASSRTKQHSYGLFWMQNRRDCFIYFALETELSCRRHMKWIKKSIKNLELHRQVFLEHRRNSREKSRDGTVEGNADDIQPRSLCKWQHPALGPLPQVPDNFEVSTSSWSRRVSRASEIYEEIFESTQSSELPRLSRRYSRTSVASGIYEEMKPTGKNFITIAEEVVAPPQPPPLPPQRKRINTFESELSTQFGEIPRCNTNPESEMAKKKKYKNMLENIFGSGRSKRSESVSESPVCSTQEVINCVTPNRYKHEAGSINVISNSIAPKRQRKQYKMTSIDMANSKRNSFSSPDLSKINFLDNFEEEEVADILNNSFSFSDDFNLCNDAVKKLTETSPVQSIESLNISQQIPNNFNFSACNTSTINLMGAHGANLLQSTQKNKIVLDDLTGYCVMAPIVPKTATSTLELGACLQPLRSVESTSSGYSTGSYCSSTSSCANSTDEHPMQLPHNCKNDINLQQPAVEESVIYENMLAEDSKNLSIVTATSPHTEVGPRNEPSDNLYENLLTIKATQELENAGGMMSTSTPTESPHTHTITPGVVESEESYYQTPRKSLISVDDKIPSYYPNSCDTVKMRRSPVSSKVTPTSSTSERVTPTSTGMKNVMGSKVRHERNENLYISSPQKIIEHRQRNVKANSLSNSAVTAVKTHKPKRPGAHKISDNVYSVTHASKKFSNSSNSSKKQSVQSFREEMKEQLQTELLQLAMLQKIDFKFDDSPDRKVVSNETTTTAERSDFLVKYENSTMSASSPNRTPSRHYLQVNQDSNTTRIKSPEDASGSAATKVDLQTASNEIQLSGMRKFASLPRFKKIDFSPLKLKINNVLQRHHNHDL